MRKIIQNIYKFRIFKRILPSILKLYIKLFDKKKTLIQHKHISLNLNLFNPIDREIFLKGEYEEKQLSFLSNFILKKNINHFLDIGAHMGFYSMMLYNKNIEIYAFEPVKTNFDQLSSNKNLNQFNDIKIYNFGLSNSEKDIEMWVTDQNKTGGYSIYDKHDTEIKKYENKVFSKIKAKTKIGDHIIKLQNKRIAVKIDVERHEDKVIEGLNNLLTNNKVFLQIELFKEREKEIFKILLEKKYNHIHTIEKDFYFTNF